MFFITSDMSSNIMTDVIMVFPGSHNVFIHRKRDSVAFFSRMPVIVERATFLLADTILGSVFSR